MKPKYVVSGKFQTTNSFGALLDIREIWYFDDIKEMNKWIEYVKELGYEDITVENGATSKWIKEAV